MKKMKVLKIQIHSAQNVGKAWISQKKILPAPFGAIPCHFLHGPKKSKKCQNFAYFPAEIGNFCSCRSWVKSGPGDLKAYQNSPTMVNQDWNIHYLFPHPGWIAARAPHRENRQKIVIFWIFPVHGKNGLRWPQIGPRGFFSY